MFVIFLKNLLRLECYHFWWHIEKCNQLYLIHPYLSWLHYFVYSHCLLFIFYLFINLINDFIVLYISLLCISYLLFLYRDFFYILILFICNLISFIYTSSNFTIPLNYSIWKFEIILDFWHIYILTHPLFVFGHLIFF